MRLNSIMKLRISGNSMGDYYMYTCQMPTKGGQAARPRLVFEEKIALGGYYPSQYIAIVGKTIWPRSIDLSNSRSNGYRGGLSANNPSILEMRGSKLRFADPSYRLPQFQVTFDGSELQADAVPSYVLLIQVTGCRA